ncbi:MAG TPA: hypothetical protein VGR28_07545 [Candidatus Thermoplasmatota archaeon]|nr:hypothetical protein [Candidatus Thermoplasmatota archaeon]
MMQHPAADALLGRRVLDRAGQDLGVVVDVGTGELRAPKFLLVGAADTRMLRVEARDVEALDAPVLRVRN